MSKLGVYYNEFDRAKAAWLRHLIEEGAIARGVVDERPIQAVQASDLRGYAQCHFFAGVGLWSLCLRRAGWADDEPVWTGSCPCGPFSVAGKSEGFADPRHLWPEWFRLLCISRPSVLFGEQSDAADAWLDLVSADLEGIGYAVGPADIPAAGFGGAHKRQRFGFVADAHNAEWWSDRAPWHDGDWPKTGRVKGAGDPGNGSSERLLGVGQADPQAMRREQERPHLIGGTERNCEEGWSTRPAIGGTDGLLGSPNRPRLSDAELGIVRRSGWWPQGRAVGEPSGPPGTGVDWLLCRDSRWRPVEPGTCPLVDESPARMGRLRGYGDAIDVEAFTNLISAYMEIAP